MAKNKISPTREKSWSGKPRKLRPDHTTRPYDPTLRLRDPKFIKKALLQALDEGDYQAVVEIYQAHLRVLNRTKSAKALHVSRQSVHKMLKPSNSPSLRTFTTFMKILTEKSAA
jgi:DNA-binding phage protein